MVREPNATMQLAPQDIQLLSKHRVLSFKPQLRLEWQGQDGQKETEQPDHSASLSDFTTSSTRIRFSIHTGVACRTADDEPKHFCLRTGIDKACIRRRVTRVELAKRGNRTDRFFPQECPMQIYNVFVWLIVLLVKSDA